MSKKRKQYSPEFKAKVALAAIRGEKTIAELGAQYELYPAQVNTWKRELLENASELFDKERQGSEHSQKRSQSRERRALSSNRQVEGGAGCFGRTLRTTGTAAARKALVDAEHPELSLVRQCQLLSIRRSSLYYRPVGPSAEALTQLRLMDEQFLQPPFYGSRRMVAYLRLRHQGYPVNRKRA